MARIIPVLVCLCEMPVSAHHSTLAYDGTRPTVISGVVATFNWRYPHTSIVLDVSDSGGSGEPAVIVTRWTVESRITSDPRTYSGLLGRGAELARRALNARACSVSRIRLSERT